jgi:uncharacterized membrane protein YphA (DoxX/SURF4 family)
MLTSFTPLAGYEDIVLLIARVSLGVAMVYFGHDKVSNFASNAKDFDKMGFKPGWIWGTLVAFLEFGGGVLMIFGVLVGIIATLFAFQMFLGGIMKAFKWHKPFSDSSYDLILLALCLVFLVYGTGPYTLF